MSTKPFPVYNNSGHNFTSGDLQIIRDYVTPRTTDEILRAEISANEITVSTFYGFHAFNLADVFSIDADTIADPVLRQAYVDLKKWGKSGYPA